MNAPEKSGKLARWFAHAVVRVYYPRIEVEGRERLPASGSVLFVANHPNSLLDPAMIGLAAGRPVHFFAKAPLFKVPVFGAVLHALGMVPAYRGADDKAQVKRNLESLDAGALYLRKGEAVGIFPEGKTHDREGLEQVRTGAARIAASAAQNGGAVIVVPMGLNYERKDRFRSAVWVRIGEPIDAGAFFRAHAEEERKAMRELTEVIEARLKSVVVHLEEERWEPFLHELEILLPPEGAEAEGSIAALRQRKRLADAMNHFLTTDRPRAEAVAVAIEQHRAQLASAGLTMDSPVLRTGMGRLTGHLLKEALWLLVGLAPAIAGTLFHLVPFALTRLTVRLVKHAGRATIALNQLMAGVLIYGLWYAVVGYQVATHPKLNFTWLWIGVMPLAGLIALAYCARVGRALRTAWQEIKMLLQGAQLRHLRMQQVELRKRLEQLKAEYYAGKAR